MADEGLRKSKLEIMYADYKLMLGFGYFPIAETLDSGFKRIELCIRSRVNGSSGQLLN